MNIENYLLSLCDDIYKAEEKAQNERRRELFGNEFVPELLIMRRDKVRVEIRKENVNHHEPHLHISHSNKFDVSISLKDFSILAGEIDSKTKKHIIALLRPKKEMLNQIWRELNERENSIGAEKLINNLNL